MSCAEKKSIEEMNQLRIADDAYIAVDALESIITVAREKSLHPAYLKEKLDKVLKCVAFMESFAN